MVAIIHEYHSLIADIEHKGFGLTLLNIYFTVHSSSNIFFPLPSLHLSAQKCNQATTDDDFVFIIGGNWTGYHSWSETVFYLRGKYFFDCLFYNKSPAAQFKIIPGPDVAR